MRVSVPAADHDAFRAASADDAAKENAALLAADAVVMTGHVTTDPAPHRVLPQCILFGRQTASTVPLHARGELGQTPAVPCSRMPSASSPWSRGVPLSCARSRIRDLREQSRHRRRTPTRRRRSTHIHRGSSHDARADGVPRRSRRPEGREADFLCLRASAA